MSADRFKDVPVHVHSPFGDDVLLLAKLTGTEALGRPFTFEMTFVSEEPELDPLKIVGEKVTVFVDKGEAEPRYFNGYVGSFCQSKYEGRLFEYRATVVPWLWFLTRSSNCRIFQNMMVPDIVSQVFRDFGFSDIINRLHDSYRTRNYCVQYCETAFNFVSRLMEEEGIYYFFKHEDKKHSIVLCDSPASHREFEGYEEMPYHPGTPKAREAITQWMRRHEVQSGAYGTTNFDFTKPKAFSNANAFQDRPYSLSSLEQFEHLGSQSPFDVYSQGAQNENERYSRVRLQELQAQFETYFGEGDVRGASTGACFKLRGHPAERLNQSYLTTNVEYLIQCAPFTSTEEYGRNFEFNVKLGAIGQEVQYRAPRVTPKPIVQGPQTATVVGPAGQKIFTDPSGYGMVKVQFRWDRFGKNDENSSCFMRVSQGWAGKQWGDMAVPHVGDEVIVECLEGDPDRPIVTGRVYNQAQMPPLNLPANNAKRIWQDDYGNRMIFDATPGDEHIRLFSPHHNSGLTLGRSAAQVTQSNAIDATMGAAIHTIFGTNQSHVFGANISTVVGSNMGVNVGGNYAANLAAQMTMNLGPQFTYTKGLDLSFGDSDFSKVMQGNILFSSAKDIALVGGAGPLPPTSSVVYAGENGVECTTGTFKEINTSTASAQAKGLAIAAMVLPVVAAIVMGSSTDFVNSYTDSNATDSDKDTALKNQHIMEGFAATAEGAGLACLIATLIMGQVGANTTPAVARHADDWNARMQLLCAPGPDGFTAKLQSEDPGGVLLAHGETPADGAAITLKSDGIVAEVGAAGDIKLVTAAGGISVEKTGIITLKGTQVKLEGMADIGGALTILGTPAPPMPPTLPATLAKLKAGDIAMRAKLNALLTVEQIRRLGAF